MCHASQHSPALTTENPERLLYLCPGSQPGFAAYRLDWPFVDYLTADVAPGYFKFDIRVLDHPEMVSVEFDSGYYCDSKWQ